MLVGQAGGATAVINASLVGVVEEARASGGFDRIWGIRQGAEGMLAGRFVDLGAVSPPTLDALCRTPGAALASSRRRLSDDDLETVLNGFGRHDVRALLYIGGNDSADTVHRLARHAGARNQALAAIAVPKTIDNDLPATDHSPGYGSIARYIAAATRDSAQDTESMPGMYPVKFIEVMGRDAGWVAAAATLLKQTPEDAPHLVYVPERPVSTTTLLAEVERTYRDFGRVVAVVTETLRDPAGRPFADPSGAAERDQFGHPLLRGTTDSLCRLVQGHLGLRARFDKPGSLQRMSMAFASSVDLEEAREVGRAAVRLALSGATDRMVTLVRESESPYRSVTGSVPLERVANRQWTMPAVFLDAGGRGTTAAFRDYAMPLLGPEPFQPYIRLSAPVAAD